MTMLLAASGIVLVCLALLYQQNLFFTPLTFGKKSFAIFLFAVYLFSFYIPTAVYAHYRLAQNLLLLIFFVILVFQKLNDSQLGRVGFLFHLTGVFSNILVKARNGFKMPIAMDKADWLSSPSGLPAFRTLPILLNLGTNNTFSALETFCLFLEYIS